MPIPFHPISRASSCRSISPPACILRRPGRSHVHVFARHGESGARARLAFRNLSPSPSIPLPLPVARHERTHNLPCCFAACAIPPRVARMRSAYRIGIRVSFQRPVCMTDARLMFNASRSCAAPMFFVGRAVRAVPALARNGESGARARLAFRILGRNALASVATSCRKSCSTLLLCCSGHSAPARQHLLPVSDRHARICPTSRLHN
jgi:hypothetical protein